MINVSTVLKLADNSGAITGKCIRILGKQNNAKVGDFLVVTIKNIKSDKKIKKGLVYKSVLIRSKKSIKRYNGIYLQFNNNSIVLLNNKNAPIGSRIRGPVCQELRKKKLMKIITMAPLVL